MAANRTLGIAVAMLALMASTANCEEGDEFDCSLQGRTDLYEKRIEFLFEEERPSSCNQCHLSGIDLELFLKDTPCNTMACLAHNGYVNLSNPEASIILQWIDRAEPASDGITEQVLREERDGFLQWIRMTAACGPCADSDNPCGEEGEKHWKDCNIYGTKPETFSTDDPGDCSDKTLELLFKNTFFPWRGRCNPCHFVDFDPSFPAPRWIGIGDCNTASLFTMRQVIDRGFVDIDDPDNSRWLLKPLDEEVGGIKHGGGPKFLAMDEQAFIDMRTWARRYAECNQL